MKKTITSMVAVLMLWCSPSSQQLQGQDEQPAKKQEQPSYILFDQLKVEPATSSSISHVLPVLEVPPCVDADEDGFCQNFPSLDCNDENPFVTQEPALPVPVFSLDSLLNNGFIHNAVWNENGSRIAFIQTGEYATGTYPTFSEAWLTVLDVLPDGSSRLSAQYEIPLSAFVMPHDVFMNDFLGTKALYTVFEWTNEDVVSAFGYGIFVADVRTGESMMIYQGIGTSEEGMFFDGGNKVIFECGRYKCGFPELCISNSDGSSLERIVDTETISEQHRLSGWALSPDERSVLYTITRGRVNDSPACVPYPFDANDELLDEVMLYNYALSAVAPSIITVFPLIPRYDELVPARHAELSFSNSGSLLVNLFDNYGAYGCLIRVPASSEFHPIGIEDSVTDCAWGADSSSILLRHNSDQYQRLQLRDGTVSPRYRLETGGHDALSPTGNSILSVEHNSTYIWDTMVERHDDVLITYLPCGLIEGR